MIDGPLLYGVVECNQENGSRVKVCPWGTYIFSSYNFSSNDCLVRKPLNSVSVRLPIAQIPSLYYRASLKRIKLRRV